MPCYNLGGQGLAVAAATDVLIATFCIDEGHELLHSDRDFEPFARHLGLKVRAQD